MPTPTDYLKKGFLRVIDPAVSFLARHNVSPNAITTVGTLLTIAAGVVYATGHIMTAGWLMSVTAVFDVIDGQVARRTGKSTVFGAFYDSTLDRVADGALMAGLTVFYATSPVHHNIYMVVVCLVGIIGTFLVSYTRARGIAGHRREGRRDAAPRAHCSSVGAAGAVRTFLERLGADGNHHSSFRDRLDHGSTADRVRLSRDQAPRLEADPHDQRSCGAGETGGNISDASGTILITKTEKEIGQIVLW